ncbi:MAG: DUF362 domain-containing protein [Desulfomonilia bacterium]
MVRVGLFQCEHYTHTVIREILENGYSMIGFSPRVFNASRIALKPNLLSSALPESAVITHPQFFRAVAESVIDHGGRPVLVESPAVAPLSSALAKGQYGDIIKTLGIEVPQKSEVRKLSYPEGKVFRYFDVAGEIFEVDRVVNIPKFKTHGLTYITAAVKNLFGVIPGLRKSQMHMRFSDRHSFSEFLLDLNGALLDRFRGRGSILHIMDAIVGMEGEGPGSSGKPRELGALIMGEDALAVDYVGCSLSGLDLKQAATITEGFKRKFFVSSPDEIEIVGDTLDDFQVPGFAPPSVSPGSVFLRGAAASPLVLKLFMDRPEPRQGTCILCYRCMQICPNGAISKADKNRKVPKYDYDRCIRCFCCSEVCPEAAIRRRKGVLQWVLRV